MKPGELGNINNYGEALDNAGAIEHIESWSIVHAIILLISSFEVLFLRNSSLMAITAMCSFLWFIKVNIPMRASPNGRPNYPNIVTFIRLLLTFLIGCFYAVISNSTIAVIALLSISMDGLDGYLARRCKSGTIAGDFFDKESDAFFVCVMCSIIYSKGFFGTWILLIGFMRYIYVLLLFFLNISQRKDSSSKFAAFVAGMLFFVLIMPFVMEEQYYVPCVLLGSFFLILSFSYSFVKTVYSGE